MVKANIEIQAVAYKGVALRINGFKSIASRTSELHNLLSKYVVIYQDWGLYGEGLSNRFECRVSCYPYKCR